MRKLMMKLAILFMIVGFCMPAYGEFLIYKVKGKVKGLDTDAVESASGSWKGYLVIDIDPDEAVIGDIVQEDILIITEIDGDDVCGIFYDVIDLDVIEEDLDGKDQDGWGLQIWAGGISLAQLAGKAKERDIGSGTDEYIAKKLKGVIMVDGDIPTSAGPGTGPDIYGTGKITLKLKSSWTKDVNEDATLIDAEDVALAIQDDEDIAESCTIDHPNLP